MPGDFFAAMRKIIQHGLVGNAKDDGFSSEKSFRISFRVVHTMPKMGFNIILLRLVPKPVKDKVLAQL